jgi:hypothetical protein
MICYGYGFSLEACCENLIDYSGALKMKNNVVKLVIVMGMLVSTNVAFPVGGAKLFDGGGPTPTCLPTGGTVCQPIPGGK